MSWGSDSSRPRKTGGGGFQSPPAYDLPAQPAPAATEKDSSETAQAPKPVTGWHNSDLTD